MGGAGTPDFFYREAQRLGYVARSAFKLLQMQKQYKLITPGSSVLDLGCAPGAWLQVACQSLGPLKNNGAVVGIDLKVCFPENLEQKVKVPAMHCDSRVQTVCADVMKLPRDQIRDLSPQQKGFSVVLSDMCPLVSGITTRDAVLSAELGLRALNLAVGGGALPHSDDNVQLDGQSDGSVSALGNNGALQPGGHLVIKLLESEEIKDLQISVQKDIVAEAKSNKVVLKRDLFDLPRFAPLMKSSKKSCSSNLSKCFAFN
nr:putative ribosomal RNA methyltransferase mrm2, mitochondrial isoform X1 [Ipomoea batatas]